MLNCPKCGKEVILGSNFCGSCGSRLNIVPNDKKGNKHLSFIIVSLSVILILLYVIFNYGIFDAIFQGNKEDKILGKWKFTGNYGETYTYVWEDGVYTPVTYIIEFYDDGRVSKTLESNNEVYWFLWELNDDTLKIISSQGGWNEGGWEDKYSVEFKKDGLKLNWVIDMGSGHFYDRPWDGVFDSGYFERKN